MVRFLCSILYAFSLIALIVHAVPTPYGSSLHPSSSSAHLDDLARLWVTHFLGEYCFLAVELIENLKIYPLEKGKTRWYVFFFRLRLRTLCRTGV